MNPQQANALEAIEVFRGNLSKAQGEFKLVLPEGVTPDRFIRVTMTAIQSSDQVKGVVQTDVGRRALLAAAMRCAQDGLMPDGREAALVVYKGQPQYMPMIGGIRKKILGSGQLSGIPAHVVYENDHFAYELGDNERLEHRPVLKDRGKPIAVYAIAIYKDGYREREVMTVDDVEKVRACSPAKNGPWATWWDQMAIKTVVKRLAKRLPLDDSAASVIETDNEFEGQTFDVSPISSDTSEFDRLAADVANDPQFIKFVSEAAHANGMTTDELKAEAAKNFDEFVASFRAWANTQQPPTSRAVNRPTKEEMAARREETRAELERLGVLEQVTKAMGDKGMGSPATWNTGQCNKALEIGREIAAAQQQTAPQAQDAPPVTVSCPNRLDSDNNPSTVLRTECDSCKDYDQCWGAD